MLKLTIKPGEYIRIGSDIQVAFVGGSANRMNILVEAPKAYDVVRSKVLEKSNGEPGKDYYKEEGLSKKAKEQIRQIIVEERRKTMQEKSKHEKKETSGSPAHLLHRT